ncbi:hypothetical protein ACEQPO_11985 [Bacillus sp. SL00103]
MGKEVIHIGKFKTFAEATIHGQIEETTAWKDFLALIKMGIVNSTSLRHLLECGLRFILQG